ncbi:hypothetical protein FNF29_06285 [Cafeteria roenbergensis]|uniref:Uncharacterized protein n=1 Tax=Cafeteria roenbergensis TaxID=33653 RepID=A0A5A8C8W6_CAFRO|nr:hypothetical protein FNF29_06285 [Cafeteria roenbergensis]|eukprot:KAA0148994.1 hypothetical protein FNF29_06285 [Cafeteria roenbergensis]
MVRRGRAGCLLLLCTSILWWGGAPQGNTAQVSASERSVPLLEGAWWQQSLSGDDRGVILFLRVHPRNPRRAGGGKASLARCEGLLATAERVLAARQGGPKARVECISERRRSSCAADVKLLQVAQPTAEGETLSCGTISVGVLASGSAAAECAVESIPRAGMAGKCALAFAQGARLPVRGPFLDAELAAMLGDAASSVPAEEWVGLAASKPDAGAQAEPPRGRAASPEVAGSGTGVGLSWLTHSRSFAEMETSSAVFLGQLGERRLNASGLRARPLSRNASVMVTVDMQTGPDTWAQLDTAQGTVASALGAHQSQHLADPAAHGLDGQHRGQGGTVWSEDSVATRVRNAAREAALRTGDFEGAVGLETQDAASLLKTIGKRLEASLRAESKDDGGLANQLCGSAGGSDCRAAELFRATMKALETPMRRGVSGITRSQEGWASSDNIGAAIERMLGGLSGSPGPLPHADTAGDAGEPASSSSKEMHGRTWLARRLRRSMAPPADPRIRHLLRRAASTASSLLDAAAHEHATRRALAVLQSGRLTAASAASLEPVAANGTTGHQQSSPALAEALEALGMHPRHGGLRSHAAAEAVFLEVASRQHHRHTRSRGRTEGGEASPASRLRGRISVAGGAGPAPPPASLEEAARTEARDAISAAATVANRVGNDGARRSRTGRHAAALAGMLLETDAAVRGLLSAGVTAKEAFACIVDSIMNVAPEILVQIIVNVVRQPFADLMSIIMSLVVPPILTPVSLPKLSFPGPDLGSKPVPVPVKCKCVKPDSSAGGGGGGGPQAPPMPDLAAMMPFPMLLQQDALDIARHEVLLDVGGTGEDSLGAGLAAGWERLAAQSERGRGGPSGGPGASGDGRMARLAAERAEGGGGVTGDPRSRGANAEGVLPAYAWDLTSVPAGGIDGGLHVGSAAESIRAAADRSARQANSGEAEGDRGPADRYLERFGRASATAAEQAAAKAAAIARLDVQTDEAVERASSLAFSSEAAVRDIMRLAEARGTVSGEAGLARLRARAALAAGAGRQGHAEEALVARLGLQVFEGQRIADEALGGHRCGCPVGSLRVVPDAAVAWSDQPFTSSSAVGVAGRVATATHQAAGRAADSSHSPGLAGGAAAGNWHAAPEREGLQWYPFLREKPAPAAKQRLDKAEAAIQQRLQSARLRVASLAPDDASSDAPELSGATAELVDKAVAQAAEFGDSLVKAAPGAARRSERSPARESAAVASAREKESIRMSGHKAPAGHLKLQDLAEAALPGADSARNRAAELARGGEQSFAAASRAPLDEGDGPAFDLDDGAVRWQTQEEFSGIVPEPRAAETADDGLLQTNERLRAARSGRRRLRAGEAPAPASPARLDAQPSLLQAAAESSAKAGAASRGSGSDKGAPVTRIQAMVHRLVVSSLLSTALPAAKDRALTGILTTLPDLAARAVVLQVAPRLVPRLTTTLSAELLRELVPRLLFRLTLKLTQQVTKRLSPRLATSVALATTRSLTRDPSEDHECYLCFRGWDDDFKSRSKSEQKRMAEWLADKARGVTPRGLPPSPQALPAYCHPCLAGIHYGVALDSVVASRVASAAQFYTDFYSSRGKSLETVTRAVRETVAEAREGFAAPDRAWDMKPEDMTLPA